MEVVVTFSEFSLSIRTYLRRYVNSSEKSQRGEKIYTLHVIYMKVISLLREVYFYSCTHNTL